MKNLIVVFFVFAAFANADDLVEFRSAFHGEYRYADWSRSFANKAATDVYYIGVPGNNELSACAGYSLPMLKSISLTPFLCGSAAKENKELGVKAAAVIAWQHGQWKADAYYAHLWTLRGSVGSYDLLDAGNLTRVLGKSNLELGVSTGYFFQDGKWNPLFGPLVRYNDHLGYWGFSYRFGPSNEIRLTRTFNLKRSHK